MKTALEIVQDFGRYLVEDGKSVKTIESYVGDVEGCVSYLETMGADFTGELKRFHVTSFKKPPARERVRGIHNQQENQQPAVLQPLACGQGIHA